MSQKADAYKKRKVHFIKKDFQFRFILKFCLIILAGVTISTGALFFFSSGTLTSSFQDSRLVIKSTSLAILPIVLYTNLITLGMITLASIAITLIVSHRLFGPLYRFEMDLKEIGAGNLLKQIHLRKEDQLKDCVACVNTMTTGLHRKVSDIRGEADQVIKSASREKVPEEIIEELNRLRQGIDARFKL